MGRQSQRCGLDCVGRETAQGGVQQQRNDRPVEASQEEGASRRPGHRKPSSEPGGGCKNGRQEEREQRQGAGEGTTGVGKGGAGGDAHEQAEEGGAAGDDEGRAPRPKMQMEAARAQRGFEGETGQRGRQQQSDHTGHSPSARLTRSSSASESERLPQSTFIVRIFASSSDTEARTGICRDGPFARNASVSTPTRNSMKRRAASSCGALRTSAAEFGMARVPQPSWSG